MTTWEEFKQLCEDIKQNPDKYNWIVIDPLSGVTIRKAEKNEEVQNLA